MKDEGQKPEKPKKQGQGQEKRDQGLEQDQDQEYGISPSYHRGGRPPATKEYLENLRNWTISEAIKFSKDGDKPAYAALARAITAAYHKIHQDPRVPSLQPSLIHKWAQEAGSKYSARSELEESNLIRIAAYLKLPVTPGKTEEDRRINARLCARVREWLRGNQSLDEDLPDIATKEGVIEAIRSASPEELILYRRALDEAIESTLLGGIETTPTPAPVPVKAPYEFYGNSLGECLRYWLEQPRPHWEYGRGKKEKIDPIAPENLADIINQLFEEDGADVTPEDLTTLIKENSIADDSLLIWLSAIKLLKPVSGDPKTYTDVDLQEILEEKICWKTGERNNRRRSRTNR